MFFNEIKNHNMKDVYTFNYDLGRYIEGEPLAVSHIIKQNGRKCRYDFIFVKEQKIEVNKAEYLYDEAIASTADHAMVVADIYI